MKVLVIGSGGREHALVWKIHQSPKVDKIYCAPGNGGISQIAEVIDIASDDIKGLADFAKENDIDITIAGPEAPLVEGLVDFFENNNLKVFGPTKEAASLEASKIYAKNLCKENNIPTSDFKIFEDSKKAKDYIEKCKVPQVIKADGLAGGKGVIVAKNKQEAKKAIDIVMVEKKFGDAGNKVIVENRVYGEEASIIVLSDGENILPLASSQDHKQVFDKDKGPNTGGMGAYSPAAVITKELNEQILDEIIKPVIFALKEKGHPYKGVLYAGLMITEEGPKLLEFNVRFGDPETQAILPRLKSDLMEAISASIEGNLDKVELSWKDQACVCVVMASGGYPGKYQKGKKITGLNKLRNEKDIIVFHAGTKKEKNSFSTAGGRVLGVTGLGKDIKDAINRTYEAVEKISFDRAHFRKDIGYKALKY